MMKTRGMNPGKIVRGALALAVGLALAVAAHAQLAGWSTYQPITVTENSGTTLNGYQLRMVIDTSAMAPGAADLRFGTDSTGGTLLDYWVESGAGTASTVVWVRLPTLPASGQTVIYMFSGNPAATSASTVNVFDYTSAVANSATNQVFGGGAGGVGDSQRGFRFSPNQDILVTDFGKNEPTGTTRWVTLFDYATQAMVAQQQISGPAASYSYQPLTSPIWLTAGTQYVLELFQGTADGYYFGTSTQINPLLTYYDMRYCNSCTQNTFPTSALSNYHYGYPDFQFRTRQTVTPAPTWVLGAASTGATATVAVPSLSEWALGMLACLLVVVALADPARRRM